MKGFSKIMLIIASIAIGVLVVVVASVAWFTSNPEVDTNEVSLSTANTFMVSFDSTLYGSNYSYDGQTGLAESGDNAAYVYQYGYFKANLRNSSVEKHSLVQLSFSTVKMECAVCEVNDILIEQLFQVQIACYVAEAGGAYALESQNTSNPNYNVFVNVGAGNGDYTLIANDYTLDADDYLYRNGARVLFSQGTYYFAFTYTFLPESLGGFIEDDEGTYVGQVAYKKIKGSGQSYSYAAGTYTMSDSGEYTQVITNYVSNVTKYKKIGNVYSVDPEGTYIKVKDHLGNDLEEYAEYETFSPVEGFPYANIRYQGAKYEFSIACSVEEV